MANIKNLEMGAKVSMHPRVNINKTFFNLCQTVVYQPSQSVIDVSIHEYAPDMGDKLERLLATSPEQMEKELRKVGKPVAANVGNVRLEVCRSRDGQFLALCLLRYADFQYKPISEVRFFEGEEARLMSALLP